MQHKLVFIETTDVLETTLALDNFRRACDCGRGAAFFSVARGKARLVGSFTAHWKLLFARSWPLSDGAATSAISAVAANVHAVPSPTGLLLYQPCQQPRGIDLPEHGAAQCPSSSAAPAHPPHPAANRRWRRASTLTGTTAARSSCSACRTRVHCRASCARGSSTCASRSRSRSPTSWRLTRCGRRRSASAASSAPRRVPSAPLVVCICGHAHRAVERLALRVLWCVVGLRIPRLLCYRQVAADRGATPPTQACPHALDTSLPDRLHAAHVPLAFVT